MSDLETLDLAQSVLAAFRARGLMLAAAESCTGGLVAAALTDIAGSSDVVDCGFVTYSNAAKTRLLGVPAELIAAQGAVSAEVAQAMAEGAIVNSRADVAVAVTGIAGPGGGTAEKLVGLVYFGLARKGGTTHTERHTFTGDRAAIRRQSVLKALRLLQAVLPP